MYRPGTLIVDKHPGDAREDNPYSERKGRCAYLPHSCDQWVIGGPTQIKQLMHDLKEALEELTP